MHAAYGLETSGILKLWLRIETAVPDKDGESCGTSWLVETVSNSESSGAPQNSILVSLNQCLLPTVLDET